MIFEPPYPGGLPVGAEWVSTVDSSTVRFPYDGSPVAEAPVGSAELARRAVDEAIAVSRAVAALPSRTRRSLLLDVSTALEAEREALERLLVLESGKPLVDCRVEVARTVVTWQAAAEEVSRVHGETVPLDLLPAGDGLTGFWTRRPIGVVIGIAGFNYPLLLASHKIAPAIAAGCPVVCKPAPQTPLATLWLVHLVREAAAKLGAPAEMVQLVTGAAEVGSTLVTDPRVGAVSFTGSAAVGHRIARDAAPRKTLLELGSNSALIVAEDADLDAAVDAVIRGGFYASGQACISVQRVLLAAPVADEFTATLLARIGEIVTGDPRDERTRVAALVDTAATERALAWVSAAVAAGARLLSGGEADGTVIRPTVLADVPDDADCWAEEVFAPVVCLRTVSDVDEAFAVANASRYGLHASVFSRSLRTAFRALDELEVGGVVVNEVPGFRSDTMPYGGVKDSGTGREGPRFAVEELTVTRMAVIRA
ncbi:aldehyde dehydrogenase family protein [Amycolatopsis minnesotensis]|uniref:Aldehyde dehydrogenase family protein n=1 Tax=Amycolatopsis minnesotensis TaxID=337894 RepID=A0ABN2RDM8_9PSEU